MTVLYVFRSLEGLLRQTTNYPAGSKLKAIRTTSDNEADLFLLLADSPTQASFAMFEPPQEKGNWGIHFSRLLDTMAERNLDVLQCTIPERSPILPDEHCTHYDLQYHRWQTFPLDIEESKEEETGYDWEIVEAEQAPSTATADCCSSTGLTVRVDKISLEDEFVLCSPYKEALLKRREVEAECILVEQHIKQIAAREPWNPQIVVAPVSRKRADRDYCDGAWYQQHLAAQDNDGDWEGIWDLVDAKAAEKSAHAVNRVKGFTVLKPECMAKKMQRIASKA